MEQDERKKANRSARIAGTVRHFLGSASEAVTAVLFWVLYLCVLMLTLVGLFSDPLDVLFGLGNTILTIAGVIVLAMAIGVPFFLIRDWVKRWMDRAPGGMPSPPCAACQHPKEDHSGLKGPYGVECQVLGWNDFACNCGGFVSPPRRLWTGALPPLALALIIPGMLLLAAWPPDHSVPLVYYTTDPAMFTNKEARANWEREFQQARERAWAYWDAEASIGVPLMPAENLPRTLILTVGSCLLFILLAYHKGHEEGVAFGRTFPRRGDNARARANMGIWDPPASGLEIAKQESAEILERRKRDEEEGSKPQ